MKYKLLKDLPGCKAGAIFDWCFSNVCYYTKDSTLSFSLEGVQNNKEWFEPVIESSEPFIEENTIRTVYVVTLKNLELKRRLMDKLTLTLFLGKEDSNKYELFLNQQKAEEFIKNQQALPKKEKIIKWVTKGEHVVTGTSEDYKDTIIKTVRNLEFNIDYSIGDSTKFGTITEFKVCDETGNITVAFYNKNGWTPFLDLKEKLKYPVDTKTLQKDTSALKEIFCKTRSQANSTLAFGELTILHSAMLEIWRKEGNMNWSPIYSPRDCLWKRNLEEKNVDTRKWVINRGCDSLEINFVTTRFQHLVFPTKELAEFSLKYHNDLWRKYYEL